MGEDADLMLESLKTSLAAVFVSSQRYIIGSFDRESPLEELVQRAIAAEQEENLDEAFDLLSQVGARVIGGESLPEIGDLPYCMTAELMDGIDAISAAMLGDDSYKEDDGTEDTGERLPHRSQKMREKATGSSNSQIPGLVITSHPFSRTTTVCSAWETRAPSTSQSTGYLCTAPLRRSCMSAYSALSPFSQRRAKGSVL